MPTSKARPAAAPATKAAKSTPAASRKPGTARAAKTARAASAAKNPAGKAASGKSVPKKSAPPKAASKQAAPASALIDAKIKGLPDWRGETLARLRALIKAADPKVVEEWKWDTPVWSDGGILCTGEVYKSVVKMTFPKGASLKDPSKLFNSSLEGNTRRAIDVREGEKLDEKALKALIQAAAAANKP